MELNPQWIDLCPIPAWLFDPETHRFLHVNEAAVRAYGYRREEFLGMTVEALQSEPGVESGTATLPRVASRHRRKDGSIIYVTVAAADVTMNGRAVRLAFAQDVYGRLVIAEEALRCPQKSRPAPCAACEVFWDADLMAGRFVWGDTLMDVFGYAPETVPREISAAREWWEQKIHPEDRRRVVDELQGMIESGRGIRTEAYRFLKADGTYAWVLDRAFVARNERGNPTRVIGMIMDVTEQIILPEKLQASHDRLERLVAERTKDLNRAIQALWDEMVRHRRTEDERNEFFALSRDMICTTDLQGRILWASAGMQRGLGYKLEELKGRHFLRLVCREDYERVKAEAQRAAQGFEIAGLEFRVCRKDGATLWTHWNASPSLTHRRVFAVGRDMTVQKHAEHVRAQLAALVESSGDAIIRLSTDGIIETWNPAAERIYGYAAGEVVGRSIDILIPPEHRGRAAFLRQGTSAHAVETFEAVRLRKDGRLIDVSVTLAPIVDGSGRLVGLCHISRDITERKRLEQESRRMLAHLTRAEKLQEVGRLASGIAHEINTPLQFVHINLEFLQEAFARVVEAARGRSGDLDALLEDIPPALEESLAGLDRIARIVTAMRDYAHPGIAAKSPADVNRLVEDAVTMSCNVWKYVAELKLDLGSSLPAVPCMADEIVQVLLNLIINAAQAIEQVGGGSRGRIEIATRREGEWVEIRVTDTGVGIPEEVRHRIFKEFFTTKEVGRGTGQGLAIAHFIVVDRHGGTIRFESRVGEGTTFFVRLPVRPRAVETPGPITARRTRVNHTP